MLIKSKSRLTGKPTVLDIGITQEEYELGMKQLSNGVLIKHVFPNLNADEQEFLITGITPAEWNEKIKGNYE